MQKVDPNAVETIIRDVASTIILPRFRNLKEGDVSFKIGDDPVTIADKEAESALSARLKDLLPGSKVVGEEDFATDSGIISRFVGESPVWVIDPIDGTRNFVAGNTVFGVIVALVKQNQTVGSWLYDPTSNEFVTAEKGAGAWYKGNRLSVLPSGSLDTLTGAFGSRIVQSFEKATLSPDAPAPKLIQKFWAGCHLYPKLVIPESYFGHEAGQIHFRATLQVCTPWDDLAGVLIHAEAGGYAAHWNEDPILPSSYARGLMLTPDKDSWHAMRTWVKSFCELPE